ncbi:hypothetical protein AAZX31_02G239600 [Glycine max]|uniref:Nematode resistance protein-like HSPRO2 n=1 Tax=Glycine max TaxID=3847 RepID=K7KAR1_SOYBN|nr:nematode resistance HS1pro1 protein [Glycine max]KAG5064378.1 hypothetical protein JHK85_005561 [Glycine max]KAH1062063.1 hypothetical protein GYH30_005194 [Glycine max]KAH1263307.1 Nematode resistance protein-like HSPRO2 [Glycine max]KRH73164.1 hypothetical protein GLYMA_02G255400v4 [Glycine max]|eukprot:NP_001236610.2 nematode resistance HS1pro1 protein [Glycine max]
MVDLDWQTKMVHSNIMPPMSPKLSLPDHNIPIPTLQLPLRQNDITAASSPICAAYDNYLRLPELRALWASKDFPNWANEPILKPALHALEITFRLLATVFSDPRPYINKREWTRRVESLATAQIQIIAMLCEDEEENPETRGKAPVTDINGFTGQSRSYSEESLLPRLATWQKSKDVAQRILNSVDYEMGRCTYTLGLGEANIAGKKIFLFDAVCRPREIHSLETTPFDDYVGNHENKTLHATQQIAECWTRSVKKLLERVTESVEKKALEKAASECHAVERIWKLLTEVGDMNLMMDPEDFLRLKKELGMMRTAGETVAFCFRSRELVEVARVCRNLREKVPEILEVEVDPKGGPGMMEAAMKVYSEKEKGKVHVLQGMQGIEVAMKRFFYAYKQVVTVMMGSSEADNGFTKIFLEPTYFPSLDAAKTFLGYYNQN